VLLLGLFNEADYGVDDALIDDGLNVGLGPIEGKEAHALDGGIILALTPCAVDYMCNLIEG
jgi:hypothetical protein